MSVEPQRFAGTDPKFFTVQKSGGINTRQVRASIKDEQFSWIENMQPVDDGTYRALFSNGSAVYSAGGGLTIVYLYNFNAVAVSHVIIFLSDGSAVDYNINSNSTSTVASAGTFWGGGSATLPACAQVGQGGVVIVSTVGANAYWAWDGTTLSSPGGAVPGWLGTGTMPSGISGTGVEIFQSRVWIINGIKLTWSSPGNGGDFNTANGSGSAFSTDAFVRRQYTAIKQANGFLYLFGDSSVNVISNVQTGGSPVVTTFNNQNVDPQSGCGWFNGVQTFSRGLIFSNYEGVFALFGGSSQNVGEDLDGLFNTTVQLSVSNKNPSAQPSTAVASINSVTTFMLLWPVQAPFDMSTRNALLMWDGKKWYIGSQNVALTFINSRQILSILQTWGTDGTNLFQLFSTASTSNRKYWQTKLWSGAGPQIAKQAMRLYTSAIDNTGAGFNITSTLDTISEASLTPGAQAGTIAAGATTSTYISGSNSVNISGRGNYMGLSNQTFGSDFTLLSQQLLYQEQSPIGG